MKKTGSKKSQMEQVRYVDYICDFYGKNFLVIVIIIFFCQRVKCCNLPCILYNNKRRKDHLQVAIVLKPILLSLLILD